ncbi:MAG: HD-GYP domain-containing protein [Acidobacteriota bacterium]|nr:HD-GYP domain-containing protein [Acidobacteriota bacterium]
MNRDERNQEILLHKRWSRTKKLSSAKKLLNDISKYYELAFMRHGLKPMEFSAEKHSCFNSNLLYLIAVTEGNEDSVGHSQLVAKYSLVLAKALGIEDKDFIANIERGALLHDIGKIGIPESILRKPTELNELEKQMVKEHPLLGYELIEEYDFLKKATNVVLYHHERHDGEGYPYGLSGQEIPLEARIFVIADTLDAITSDRPYRKGQGFEVAFEEIEKGEGTQFDPSVVEAFFSIPEDMWCQVKSIPINSPQFFLIH